MDNSHNNNGFGKTDQPVFSMQRVLTTLFKRKQIIISFFVAVVAIVTVFMFFSPHIFEASAKVLLQRQIDPEKALLLRMNTLAGVEEVAWLNSEMAIMRSYPVAEKVVTDLELWKGPDLDTIPVNPAVINELTKEAIESLQSNLVISNVKESNVVGITYEDQDRGRALSVVSKVIAVYAQYRSELYSETEEYRFFEVQMKEIDRKLNELERSEADFKQAKEIISPEVQQSILMTRLTDYQRALSAIKIRRIGKEAKIKLIRDQLLKGGENIIPDEDGSNRSQIDHITHLKEQLFELELQREQLLQEFTPEYVEVVNIEKQIKTTRDRITHEVRQILELEDASLLALIAEENELERQILRTRRESKKLAAEEYELSQISRDISDTREVYSMLLKQREEARISLARLQNGINIKTISPPTSPIEPVRPKKRMTVILAAFFGLIGGIGLAFVLEFFDRSVHSPEDLARSGIPSLGTIGDVESEMPKRQSTFK